MAISKLHSLMLKTTATILVSVPLLTQAAPIPVDLSTWQSDGNSSWQLQSGNDSVRQGINGEQTVFFEAGSNAQGTQISGSIEVGNTFDDDFIGFVLGYQDNELTSSTSEFLLIDWKQQDQTLGGSVVGNDGLAISLVNGVGTFDDYWAHTNAVVEKKRATNLGSTGWVENQTYLFDITFTSSLVQVFVDNVLEISLTAAEAGLSAFSDGAAGFYNNSQDNVFYTGITEQVVQPPVNANAPALFGLMVLAMGALFARRKV